MKPTQIPLFLVVALKFLGVQAAAAAEAYYLVPITSLKLSEGALPTRFDQVDFRWNLLPTLQPRAVLEGPGEIYIQGPMLEPWGSPADYFQNATVAVWSASGGDVTGKLFVPREDLSGMDSLIFSIPAGLANPETRGDFLKAKESHYSQERNRDIPGAAWFRHQESTVAKVRDSQERNLTGDRNRTNPRPPTDVESSYALFSGGRAISENLQLDRPLAFVPAGEDTVNITNLAGITVQAMDWKPLIGGATPELDILAKLVPFDQHAVFFPSFASMTEALDEADQYGTPVLALLEPRSEDGNSRGRYQRQLCLELNEISRLLGPKVIDSIAFTGSDPYLRTGTDTGILFETKSPDLLQSFLAARQSAVREADKDVQPVQGEIQGVAYTGVVSPDRSVSSYMAVSENAVVVCNSLYQLGRLVAVAKSGLPSLASQEEYVYFRKRYPRGDADERGLLILTDAAIRRWCSPQWRIGNARRTEAAAVMADWQAAHLDALVAGTIEPGTIPTSPSTSHLGEVRITSKGVASSVFGTLDFLTPIAELSLSQVTQAEANAYNQWRNNYQSNWRQFFDPIAVRFGMNHRQLSLEVSVMPLIAGSDYNEFISLTRGASIKPESGDRHAESLLHVALSINKNSELLATSGNFLGSMMPSLTVQPLGWVGSSIAVYADQDPFWKELADASRAELFMETNYHRLPLGIHFEVANPLGLTVFLSSLRAFVEQTAPRMTVWTNASHRDQPYVTITPTQQLLEGGTPIPSLYYAVTPSSLLVTMSESVIQRALGRQIARATVAPNGQATNAPSKPWLGSNLCLQVDRSFLDAIDKLSRDQLRSAQQALSWSNLPILNEWKRRYPAKDPVQLHEEFWQAKLTCPGGGTYVWNATWQTMESTVYGHPGVPKEGPSSIPSLSRFAGANLGLTFEDQGLSARVILDQRTKSAPEVPK